MGQGQEQEVFNSPVTQRIADSTDLFAEVYNDTVFQVRSGVEETDIHYLSSRGDTMHVFILEVDLNNPEVKLEAAISYNGTSFERQTVPTMTEQADSAGNRVIAGINADFFDPDAPWGIAVEDGEILKDTWSRPRSKTFLAILGNGDPYVGNQQDFSNMQDNLYDALGGTEMLIMDNYIVPQSITSQHPRTGAGVTDAGILYFIVADGREPGYSIGMTLPQLAKMLKACGASKALNLDGGGSSTFLIRHNGEWEVRNRPSDGSPRAVSNAWLIISEE